MKHTNLHPKYLPFFIVSILISLPEFASAVDGTPEPDDKLSPAELAVEHAKVKAKLSSASWELGCTVTSGKPFYQRMIVQPSGSSFAGTIHLYDNSSCTKKLFTIPFSYQYNLGEEIKVAEDDYAFKVALKLTSQPIPVGLASSNQTIYVGKTSFSLSNGASSYSFIKK